MPQFQPDSSGSDVFFILAIIALALSVVYYLLYSQRFLGWLLTKLLARVLDRTVQLTIGGVVISPLSGRISVLNLRYFSRNSSLRITDGSITFRWWGKHCHQKNSPNRANFKIHFNGLEWTLYNNAFKYEDIEKSFKSRGLSQTGEPDFQGLVEDPTSYGTHPDNPDPAPPDADKKTLDTHRYLLKFMHFVGSINYDIREGTIALGAPDRQLPFFFRIGFKRAHGRYITTRDCPPEDLFRNVVDTTLTGVNIRLVKTRGAGKEPEASPSCSFSRGDEAPQMRPLSDGHSSEGHSDHDGVSSHQPSFHGGDEPSPPRRRVRGLSRLAKGAYEFARGMKFAFCGDKVGFAANEDALEMHRYIVMTEPEQLAQTYGVLLDAEEHGVMRLVYFMDMSGVETKADEHQSVRDLPKMGLKVTIHSKKITYGPFLDFLRGRIQKLFFPWDYRTWGEYRPRNGDWRAMSCYEQVVQFSSDCTIHVPWKQKTEIPNPPFGITDSGVTQEMRIFVREGSRYVYKYPFLQHSKDEGVMTEMFVEFLDCRIWTSLNNSDLLRARELRIFVDSLFPPFYVFNQQQRWDIIFSARGGEMTYLSDHMTYIFDLLADWSYPWATYLGEDFREGWCGSRDFMVKEYVPYIQRYELLLDDFDINFVVNDGNVINSHGTREDNAVLTLRVSDVYVEYICPFDVFTSAQENEFDYTYQVDFGPVELLLSLPDGHGVLSEFGDDLPECFGHIGAMTIKGFVNSQWPNTDKAQGRKCTEWEPRREVPSSWEQNLYPRKGKPPDEHKHKQIHDMVDKAELNISMKKVTMVLMGWHINHLKNWWNNYFSMECSFVSPAEFARFASAAHPSGRNLKYEMYSYVLGQIPSWKTKETLCSLVVDGLQLYFPFNPRTVFLETQLRCTREVKVYGSKRGGESDIISPSERITIIGESGGWARIQWNAASGEEKEGWTPLDCLNLETRYRGYTPREPGFWQGTEEGGFVDVCTHEIALTTFSAPTVLDMSVCVTPIVARLPLPSATDKRTHQQEFFTGVNGLTYNSISLYGAASDPVCFHTKTRVQIGTVTSHLLVSQVVMLEALVDLTKLGLGMQHTRLQEAIQAEVAKLSDDPRTRRHSMEEARTAARKGSLFGDLHEERAFRTWFEARERRVKEAERKAYHTSHYSVTQVLASAKLDLGYVNLEMPTGVTFADTSLHDATTSYRGTLILPLIQARVLNYKSRALVSETAGDQLEVGSIMAAIRVRVSKSQKPHERDTRDSKQSHFLHRFNLAKYNLSVLVDLEGREAGGPEAHRRRNSLTKKFKSHAAAATKKKSSLTSSDGTSFQGNDAANPIASRVNKAINVLRRENTTPVISRSLNFDDPPPSPPDTPRVKDNSSFDVSPTTVTHTGAVPSPVHNAREQTRSSDEELQSCCGSLSDLPHENTIPLMQSCSEGLVYSPAFAASSAEFGLETCRSNISEDDVGVDETPEQPAPKAGIKPMRLIQRVPPPEGLVPVTSNPLPPRRPLDVNRPTTLADLSLCGARSDSPEIQALESDVELTSTAGLDDDEDEASASPPMASQLGFDLGRYEGDDDEQGRPVSEYAGCLRSGRLYASRGTKDSVLLYGRKHRWGQATFSHAPLPTVQFLPIEGRSARYIPPLFGPAGSNPSSTALLMSHPPATDTWENLNNDTATTHTNITFLQPLHVLVTQRAACLLVHALALHSVWRQDLRDQYNMPRPDSHSPPRDPVAVPPDDRRRHRATVAGQVEKKEDIVSVSIPEVLVVAIAGLEDTKRPRKRSALPTASKKGLPHSGVPHSIRLVLQGVSVVASERSVCGPLGPVKPPQSRSGSASASLIALSVQCLRSTGAGGGNGIKLTPLISPSLQASLLAGDFKVLAALLITSPPRHSACRARGKVEELPTGAKAVAKLSLDVAKVRVMVGAGAYVLKDLEQQVMWVKMLWEEVHSDPDPDETVSHMLDGDEPASPVPDISTPVSYVNVDPREEYEQYRRPSALKRVRCAMHRILFGPTEMVGAALTRRAAQRATVKAPPDLLPPYRHRSSAALSDSLVIVGNLETPLAPPVLSNPDIAAETQTPPDTRPVTLGTTTPPGTSSLVERYEAVHITLSIEETKTLLYSLSTSEVAGIDGAGSAGEIHAGRAVFRILVNDKGTSAAPSAPSGMVPVTVVAQMSSFSSEVQPSIVEVLSAWQAKPSVCTPPSPRLGSSGGLDPRTTPPPQFPTPPPALPKAEAKEEGNVSFYVTTNLENIDVKIKMTQHNYVAFNYARLRVVASNRLNYQPASSTSARPGHMRTRSDGTPGTREHTRNPSDLNSPANRSRRRSKQVVVEEANVTSKLMVSFFADAPFTVAYSCEPVDTVGSQEIFSLRLSKHSLCFFVRDVNNTLESALHLSTDSATVRVLGQEWLYSDHFLNEWKAFLRGWQEAWSCCTKDTPLADSASMQMSPATVTPPVRTPAEDGGKPRVLVVTCDFRSVEAVLPLTEQTQVTLQLRRVVVSLLQKEKKRTVRVHLHPGTMWVRESHGLHIPGVRAVVTTEDTARVQLWIDRVDAVLSKDIVSSWLHIYSVVAPEAMRWMASQSDEPLASFDEANASEEAETRLEYLSVMSAGIRVSLVGETAELCASSGMALVRYHQDTLSAPAPPRCSTEINLSAMEDDCPTSLPHCRSAPTSPVIPPYQTQWYIRLPTLGLGVYDVSDYHGKVEADQGRRMSVQKVHRKEDRHKEEESHERLRLGFKWGTVSTGVYAGNCPLESIVAQDRPRTHSHSSSGGGSDKAASTPIGSQGIPTLVVEKVASGQRESLPPNDKANIEINNTTVCIRAGFTEEIQGLLAEYKSTFRDFKQHVERDRQKVLSGSMLFEERGKRILKKTSETIRKVHKDPAGFVSSYLGSFAIRNTSITVPFGDRAYWKTRAVAVFGAPSLLPEDMGLPQGGEEQHTIDSIWGAPRNRFIPMQALQAYLGEAAIATLTEMDTIDVRDLADIERLQAARVDLGGQPKKITIACKVKNTLLYFSEGHPAARRKNVASLHTSSILNTLFQEMCGPYSHPLGGRGIFHPASRDEFNSEVVKNKCCIKEISIRARGRMWQRGLYPLKISCDITGPQARVAPTVVCAVTGLMADFTPVPEVMTFERSLAEHRQLCQLQDAASPCLGAPDMLSVISNADDSYESTVADGEGVPPYIVDADIIVKCETGTIAVHTNSDRPLSDNFKHVTVLGKGLQEVKDEETMLLRLPTPSLEVRGCYKVLPVPSDKLGAGSEKCLSPSEAFTETASSLTLTALVGMPPGGVSFHPGTIYFVKEVSMCQQVSGPRRQREFREDLEAHVDSIAAALAQSDGKATTNTNPPIVVSVTAANGSAPPAIFIGPSPMLDVILPVPRALVAQAGCGEDCDEEHVESCLRCGRHYKLHRNHRCPITNQRGSWALAHTVTLSPTVSAPPTPPPPPHRNGDIPAPASVFTPVPGKTISVATVGEQTKIFEMRVRQTATDDEVEKELKENAGYALCWNIVLRMQGKPVRLQYAQLVDGGEYTVEPTGMQIVLLVRIRPLSVEATTTPKSDCHAVLETGVIDVNFTRSTQLPSVGASILLSLGARTTTGVAIRVAVKDRVHECINVSLGPSNVYYTGGGRQCLIAHLKKGAYSAEQSIRVSVRLGNLRSFYIVYKMWKQKSDEAVVDLKGRPENTDTRSEADPPAQSTVSHCYRSETVQMTALLQCSAIHFELDNFRTSTSDPCNDKVQLQVENTTVVYSEKRGKDGAVVPGVSSVYSPNRSYLRSPLEGATPLSMSTTSSNRNLRMKGALRLAAAALSERQRQLMKIRNIEVGIGSLSVESQGRVASPGGATKTLGMTVLRASHLTNPHDIPVLEALSHEDKAITLHRVVIELPPLEVELREMYKPLLRVRPKGREAYLQSSDLPPMAVIKITDAYRLNHEHLARGSSPLQGYSVDVSVTVEYAEVELRPLIFPKISQMIMEGSKTSKLQEAEADRALRGKTHAGGRRAADWHRHPLPSPQHQDPHHLHDPQGSSSVCFPRGTVSLRIGELILSLGNSSAQSGALQIRTRQLRVEMAETLQRVDQRNLWDLLTNMLIPPERRGKVTCQASAQAYEEAVRSGAISANGTVGRVDRIVKDLVVTSWRVSRSPGDGADLLLLKGERDSRFTMQTNQILSSPVVEYTFWSSFQAPWEVGKTQEFLAARQWADAFSKEASGHIDPLDKKAPVDVKQYWTTEGGFAFSPTLQVVGESTLPISSMLGALGVEECMVPRGFNTYLGDSLEVLLLAVYKALAPGAVVDTNARLVEEMKSTFSVVQAAHHDAMGAVQPCDSSPVSPHVG